MPAVTDEQSPSSPSPRSPFRLGFLPATPDDLPSSPLPTLDPSTSTSLDDELEQLAGSDSDGDYDETSFPESLDDTPSPGSTPASEPVKVELFDEDELKAIARGGVAVAGQKAHDLFATTEGQKAAGVYLTDEEDQANIGDPLASIAARHQGVAGKVNPDTKDLLTAMVGLFGYATKQINRRTEARALDAGAAGPQPMPQAVDL